MVCQASLHSGFTSVIMDGSLREDMKTPSSYEYNVAVTAKVIDMAHAELRDEQDIRGQYRHALCVPERTLRRRDSARPSRAVEINCH